jgi:hypothetical protein
MSVPFLFFQTILIAVIADLLSVNRKLIEEVSLSLKVILQNNNSDREHRNNHWLCCRKANV